MKLKAYQSWMPIQVSSSKSLCTRWWGRVVELAESRLLVDRRDDSLRGQFTNPLDVELSDCILSYGSWTYRLDRKLAAHETIDVLDQMLERSLNVHLNRRNVDEDKYKPWDPTSADVSRIVEIMMYYREAGGRAYTDLSHRYQTYVDMSGHLHLDRAILTGWTDKRAGELTRDGKPLTDDYDRQWTFYRVIFPVEKYKR